MCLKFFYSPIIFWTQNARDWVSHEWLKNGLYNYPFFIFISICNTLMLKTCVQNSTFVCLVLLSKLLISLPVLLKCFLQWLSISLRKVLPKDFELCLWSESTWKLMQVLTSIKVILWLKIVDKICYILELFWHEFRTHKTH